MTALAIVQARMSSSRLPGKVLADIGGISMLELLVHRLKRAQKVEKIVIATSIDPTDDPIISAADSLGISTCRGSLDDVLARYIRTINTFAFAGAVVRITADCPLIDPEIVDSVIALFETTDNCTYASNIHPRAHPDGLDVEVFASEALINSDKETHDLSDREHVTQFLRNQKKPGSVQVSLPVTDPTLGELRWTVDTEEDLVFVRRIVERLGEKKASASWRSILEATQHHPPLTSHSGNQM